MRYTTDGAAVAPPLVAQPSPSSLRSPGFQFTPAQRERLLAAKANFYEGERHLDNLAELARHEAGLQRLRPFWESLRTAGDDLGCVQAASALLPRVRALVGNSALNQSRATSPFAQALQSLVYGEAALPERLQAFLAQGGIGPRSTSDLLYAAFPDRFPRLSPALDELLALTPLQKAEARRAQQQRYTLAEGEISRRGLDLLAQLAIYDEARRVLGVSNFAALDAIVRQTPGGGGEATAKVAAAVGSSAVVQETSSAYGVSAPETAPVEPTEADLLRLIDAHVASKGFTFGPLVVANYYIALKAKPFVILTGLSGTGKTRLTRLVADAITDRNSDQYLLLPVRPDWTDGTPLFGYHNLLTGKYQQTALTNLLSVAAQPENRARAFFVCLDEMNLARVEHYFADALSAMETDDGKILLHEGRFVTLGPNVYLTGSVNQDEATFPFSRKVLDRANTLEFADVKLDSPGACAMARHSAPEIAPLERQRLFQEGAVRTRSDAEARLTQIAPDFAPRIIETLSELNARLTARGLHFGYRVRDEILRYAAASFTLDGGSLLAPNPADNLQTALDLQVLQKVLPRIAGTDDTLSRLLRDLTTWSEEQGFGRSAAKLEKMRSRAAEEGIVTFYEM